MALGIFVNPFGWAINPFPASEYMIILSPLLATYFGRRYTDHKENEVSLKHNINVKIPSQEPKNESD